MRVGVIKSRKTAFPENNSKCCAIYFQSRQLAHSLEFNDDELNFIWLEKEKNKAETKLFKTTSEAT